MGEGHVAHDETARRGARCDSKATFLAGLAVGFVAGARAGRERYEQIVTASRKVAENPTVQKATKATGTKATELTKVAKDKAAERVPKLTETAKSGASKMRGQFDRLPGLGTPTRARPRP